MDLFHHGISMILFIRDILVSSPPFPIFKLRCFEAIFDPISILNRDFSNIYMLKIGIRRKEKARGSEDQA